METSNNYSLFESDMASMAFGGCWYKVWAIATISALVVVGIEGDAMEEDFMDWVQRLGKRVENQKMSTNASNLNSNSNSEYEQPLLFVVDKTGIGQHKSLQAAINSIPSGNNKRVVIHVGAGLYKEKVMIPKNKGFITLEGDGARSTIITWDDTTSSSGSTSNSATMAIESDYFIASGITFKNTAIVPQGSSNKQAVALRISGDKVAFYNCNFIGSQDTLFDDKGKHYFENCYIQGSVDFICGNGQSLYKGCVLNGVSHGYFTAQKRGSPNEQTGFSFVGCKVTGSGMLYLGRPWGKYSRVVFSNTYMDTVVIPAGWKDWDSSHREKTIFYGEYKCSGPGANIKGRVAWSRELTDAQAEPFQSIAFIDGSSWIKA